MFNWSVVKRSVVKTSLFLGLMTGSFLLLGYPAPARAVSCASFKTQPEAQAYMEKSGAANLDRDRDGIACEALPKARSPIFLKRVSAPTSTYRIASVGDGDTIRVVQGTRHQTITVRLACIDAPEMRQGVYGPQASQRLKQLLPVGQTVNLKIGATDRYGRKVAEVIRQGRNINLQMVREGQAVVYRRYLSTCSQPLQQALVKAESLAQRQRIGFWQQANPVLPEDYRRMQQR